MKIKQGKEFTTSSAPALTRGLAILQLLAKEGSLSLEQIARRLELPKASAHRLLETLEKATMIRRTPDKSYEALWHLRPAESALITLRSRLEHTLPALAQATGCTSEWYEPTTDGMQLILQKNPESELCVKARPGFLRDWSTELEAVARLGLAFASQAPSSISQSQQYTENGVLTPLAKRAIAKQIHAAKAARTAYDEVFNTNGVRRIAVAAFDPESQVFLGVLAIAEIYHFARKHNPSDLMEQLKQTLK